MGISAGEVILLIFLIGLSLLDIFLNTLSLIPVLGNILETLSETVIESIQIVLVLIWFAFTRE